MSTSQQLGTDTDLCEHKESVAKRKTLVLQMSSSTAARTSAHEKGDSAEPSVI